MRANSYVVFMFGVFIALLFACVFVFGILIGLEGKPASAPVCEPAIERIK